MIETISHLADIHIRKSPRRNGEYREVFNNLYKSLEQKKPSRIVIAGDLMHDYIDIQGEQLILASEFLTNLSKIAPIIITRGNHDVLKKSLKRTDPIFAIVETLKNERIKYLNKTGFYEDENVVWAVWHHGDKESPWTKNYKKIENKIYIDIFHDPISGCLSPSGFEFKSSNLINLKSFNGDYSLFGDIHKKQYFSNKTKAYPGSLIAQDFSEGDNDFHGYLFWNIINNTVDEIEIPNDYSYKTIKINSFTDFDDLDDEIVDSPTKNMRIRLIWNCLPQTMNNENQRKIEEHLKKHYSDIILLTHKQDFIEENKIDDLTEVELTNIFSKETQHEVFREYFTKIGVDDDIILEILKLDDEISGRITSDELTSIQWDIVKYWGENLFSYEKFNIDWRELNGLTQITGKNAGGKTTLLTKTLTYILYGKSLETMDSEKNGDARFVNKNNGAKYCEGNLVIVVNNQYYGIKRRTTIEYNKQGEIKGSPTQFSYYLLTTPDDDFNDENLVDNLDLDRKVKTQKEITKVIGSFDNFIRIVMTTSDTLNAILSSKPAEFIDSILLDSGMDIFDLKLNEFKEYIKEANKTPRIVCDITLSKNHIDELNQLNENINNRIKTIKEKDLPDINKRILNGEDYVQKEMSKLFNIDNEILTLNVDDISNEILKHENRITELTGEMKRLEDEINVLPENFDEEKLNALLEKKDFYKNNENNKKFEIKNIEREIIEIEHKISILKGENLQSNNNGKQLKADILTLKNSKNCPTCGQLINDKKHHEHLNAQITKIVKEQMPKLVESIDKNNQIIDNELLPLIENKRNLISEINRDIEKIIADSTNELDEIGKLTNRKNDYEKRKRLTNEKNNIPTLIENNNLKINLLNEKIKKYHDSKIQIQQNETTEANILKGKNLLSSLKVEINTLNETLLNENNKLNNNLVEIKKTKDLIVEYKKQLRVDNIRDLYKNAIHRNGIPTQLLKNNLIPKINRELESTLKELDFKVWIDSNDLKLKLMYGNNTNGIINAISGSGKERTFSSIALKFALNQINMKSKPMLMLLDEMMGKLTEESVDEFKELLNEIIKKLKKIVIIEHNHELNPDHIINITKDENSISSYEFI